MSKATPKRLGDIVNFKRGYDLPSHLRKHGSVPIISSGGISGYHSEYKASGEGVVTGRYGTLGEVYYVNGKYWPHNTALYATTFYDNSPKYVYYLMKCLGNLQTSDKSTVPGINRNDLHEIIVPYLFQEDQLRIATTLSLLDNKIELNNRINAELEQMAKTLYDYWFVQFDFPNEDGKPYKSSGGKMVYDEVLKREIPEGWDVKPLSEINLELTRGISPKYTEDTGLPVINQRCVRNNTVDFSFCRLHDAKAKPVRKLVQVGDILVNSTGVGTLGRVAVVKRLEHSLTTADSHVTIVRADSSQVEPYYLGISMLNRQAEIEKLGEGSTGQTELNREKLGTLNVLLPKRSLQDQFADIIKTVLNRSSVNEQQNQQLASLRDWLLPMLINGQVTVGDVPNRSEEDSEGRVETIGQEGVQMHLFA
ncbi:hypothetical protein GCM10010967_13130 [Dyadobacter beijingensis]|uniref:Type I restriction modification DNA specificity domain-containing protein n=1 Tax=Dyadobacter beijingensis TaxID=365489 RepID=A0ABQ2HIG5_9BACT|nr:restriction endonuclease subunit S [Dyadobacter beijingensis]GGM82802.1 hypothetical protein GCM10010967_13130 [Dyadobacter beijingensis]